MITDKMLKYGEIIAVCWVLVYGIAGIIIISNGNSVHVPVTAWWCLGAMLLGSILTHYIRKEKKLRDREGFLTKYPQLRSVYE